MSADANRRRVYPDRVPRPDVARALAELALAHDGDWTGTRSDLLRYLTDRLGADHPAARHHASAARASRAARPLLAHYGLVFCQRGRCQFRVCLLGLRQPRKDRV